MRSLGDDYVKSGTSVYTLDPRGRIIPTRPSSSEFRRHKDITNPVYTMGFLTQWKMYLDQLPVGPDARAYKGKRLDPTIFEKVGLYPPPPPPVGTNRRTLMPALDVVRAAGTAIRSDARH